MSTVLTRPLTASCHPPANLRVLQMAALLGPLPEELVRGAALGPHLDLSALCQPSSAAAAAAVAPSRVLPPELEQRAAAAAASSGLQAPAPPQCQLYAELAGVDASLADLVVRLLAYDPVQRITAHQVCGEGDVEPR